MRWLRLSCELCNRLLWQPKNGACIVPSWRSATIVIEKPDGARYVCEHLGWWYYVDGATIYARRAI